MLGDKVTVDDEVMVNGQTIKPLDPDDTIFIILNKPVGIVCTAAETDRRNIVDFVDHSERIYPVGRLDKSSQGLIFAIRFYNYISTGFKPSNPPYVQALYL